MEFVLLLIAIAGAVGAAVFAFLGFLRTSKLPDLPTAHGVAQMLRAETDLVRAAVDEQSRCLRQELGHSLKEFQELTFTAFGNLRDGIDAQVRGFGERLDGGIKAIDERAAFISTKLNDEMAQMRTEANINRETLRALIEQKLDHSVGKQAEASQNLREELGGNFRNLGSRVSKSLGKSSQLQKERLETLRARSRASAKNWKRRKRGFGPLLRQAWKNCGSIMLRSLSKCVSPWTKNSRAPWSSNSAPALNLSVISLSRCSAVSAKCNL